MQLAAPTPRPDEVWVIPRAEGSPGRDDAPGSGALLTEREGEPVPVPLEHTDIRGQVSAHVATVDVAQRFVNPFDTKIEAVYVFPLPHDAAVRDFLMQVGERTIRGIIREKEEARRVYEAARAQGYVASLLEQERPNVFEQKVANIEPGKSIEIKIRYFHALAWRDGSWELAIPLVVGPRFNPPGSRGGIGAVGRQASGSSGQPTEVSYLRPGERSGHDVAIRVDVDAGVAVESFASPTHSIDTERQDEQRFSVSLRDADRIPNRDFVLRYRVAGAEPKPGLLVHRGEDGAGYFTLMLVPPVDLDSLPRRPVEMVFVLDASGSMSGWPIEIAKRTIRSALERLTPEDTFQILRFSDRASTMGRRPVPATEENVRRGVEHLNSLRSQGGTMMVEGVRAALGFPADPERVRVVSFFTDGYIGNEAEILGEVDRLLGRSRIFSFGVGKSVNRYLLAGMARIGRGAVAWVGAGDAPEAAVESFYRRCRHPLLTDVRIDWGSLPVRDVFPARLPDVLAGRPLLVAGRCDGDALEAGRKVVRIVGRGPEGEQSIEVEIDLGAAASHPGLASLWARRQIEELSDQELRLGGSGELADEIRRLALEHGIASRYTSFVAVDSLSRTAGGYGVTVPVPVPVPDGVRYETTVTE